jgi:excisionase family DNA binding protein
MPSNNGRRNNVRTKKNTGTRFFTVGELAELLHVNSSTIYRHVSEIPHIRIGDLIRFDMESRELKAWLKKGTRTTEH